jgi:rare lipoprotein A
VRVNDRGPHARGRIVDLSRRAAGEIGMLREGVVEVAIRVVSLP